MDVFHNPVSFTIRCRRRLYGTGKPKIRMIKTAGMGTHDIIVMTQLTLSHFLSVEDGSFADVITNIVNKLEPAYVLASILQNIIM